MKARVCSCCHKEVSLDATRCPHCDFEFKTHETTLRCPVHGATFKARVSSSGEVLSGNCPMCMESDDREFSDIDREIAACQKKMGSLDQMKKDIRLLGFDLRLWGIALFALMALFGLIVGGGFIGGSLVVILAALYLVGTFFLPSLPLSPQWIVSPKQAEVQKKIKELTQKKKNIIQRSMKQ